MIYKSIENFSNLELKQMKTIDNLQEKIRLLQIDISQDKAELARLNKMLNYNKSYFVNLIKKLENIRDNQNYGELNNVIRYLKINQRYEDYKDFEDFE